MLSSSVWAVGPPPTVSGETGIDVLSTSSRTPCALETALNARSALVALADVTSRDDPKAAPLSKTNAQQDIPRRVTIAVSGERW
jgi:hypothetical protein